VDAIAARIRPGKIQCRVYITHARLEVVGSAALVGSSNFTHPGLTENIELNVQITGRPVTVLQEWHEEHWNAAEDVTLEILTAVKDDPGGRPWTAVGNDPEGTNGCPGFDKKEAPQGGGLLRRERPGARLGALE
jgi:hypothetical protein